MKSNKKILIIASNPKDLSGVRLDEEVREINEGLKRSKYRSHFIIKHSWATRIRDVRRAILDFEPDILHFSGYGSTNGLIVENDAGEAEIIKPKALSSLFKLFSQKISCVLLNSSYSEVQAKEISNHIKYVIGLKKEINDNAAIEFIVGFYDALGAGKSIEEAFKFGCNAIQLYGFSEEGAPILFKTKEEFKKKVLSKELKVVGNDHNLVKAFLVAAGPDEKYVEEFSKHLRGLERKYNVEFWDETKLKPSEKKSVTIDKQIETSDIFVFFLTAELSYSDSCLSILNDASTRLSEEPPPILIPLYIDFCGIPDTLNDFMILPNKEHPLNDKNFWVSSSQPYMIIVNRIEEAIKEILNENV